MSGPCKRCGRVIEDGIVVARRKVEFVAGALVIGLVVSLLGLGAWAWLHPMETEAERGGVTVAECARMMRLHNGPKLEQTSAEGFCRRKMPKQKA